jgi:NADP-dependent 3-hydroxy acid dehydrogenase YdfG
MSDWKGKVAVITGGSSGLGLTIARQLLAAGAHVVLAARDSQRLERLVGK